MKKLCLFIVFLSGCAVNSGVIPMGDNTYMISRQAPSGFHGMGKLKAEAVQEAYAECQKTQKAVKVLEANDAKPPYIFGNFPKTEFTFKCVEPSN